MSKFKPMLAPNEKTDLDEVKYPILASFKLDGIRCLFIKGEMLSRSLKPIVNKQLREKFKKLIEWTKKNNVILDGEIYSPDLTFQEITRYVMTKDFNDPKSIKKHGEILIIPEHLKFYCFDMIGENNLGEFEYNETFMSRTLGVMALILAFKDILVPIHQENINSSLMVSEYFEHALENGYEGLILKDPNGRYKTGRGTIKEGLIYKVKPFKSIEAKVVNVIQATEVDPNAEKKINELGRSETSRKKNDRLLIEKASAVSVYYEDKLLKVTLAMTDLEKEEIWKNKDKYIGKWIEYKYLVIGMKDNGLPRHPTSLRWRNDKE